MLKGLETFLMNIQTGSDPSNSKLLVTAEVAEVVAFAESPKERGFSAELDAAGIVEAEVVADLPNENVGLGTREVGRDQLVTLFENL